MRTWTPAALAAPRVGCSAGPDADGDTVPDVCDNCPTMLNPAQAAMLDDDEVSDPCDPRPALGSSASAPVTATPAPHHPAP